MSATPTTSAPADTSHALAPASRHDYTVWRSMDRAPREGYPIERVQLLMEDGRIIPDAHWAYGDGDGMMPPFGPGWFAPVHHADGSVSSYAEVSGVPKGWAPRSQADVGGCAAGPTEGVS